MAEVGTVEPHTLLNALSADQAQVALARCCGAQRWVQGMLALRPFASTPALLRAAQSVWTALEDTDYLEAFSHHPEIGSDLAKLREKFAATAGWSSEEQSSVTRASESTLEALRDANLTYRTRFGFIFIVCASGKSADEMLALLRARIGNDAATELAIAAEEQAKITALRLEKLAP